MIVERKILKNIILAFTFIALTASCSNDDANQRNRNNFNNGFWGQNPGGPHVQPPGVPGGTGIADQFSPAINQAASRVNCPRGRISIPLSSGPSGQNNIIYGPFQMGAPQVGGQTIAAYIGGNAQTGDLMIVRKLGFANQVTGFHMELLLCIDGLLVAPNRQLSNFQVSSTGIVLDQTANCTVGDIDYAYGVMFAQPAVYSQQPSPVYMSFTKIQGANLCGYGF